MDKHELAGVDENDVAGVWNAGCGFDWAPLRLLVLIKQLMDVNDFISSICSEDLSHFVHFLKIYIWLC